MRTGINAHVLHPVHDLIQVLWLGKRDIAVTWDHKSSIRWAIVEEFEQGIQTKVHEHNYGQFVWTAHLYPGSDQNQCSRGRSKETANCPSCCSKDYRVSNYKKWLYVKCHKSNIFIITVTEQSQLMCQGLLWHATQRRTSKLIWTSEQQVRWVVLYHTTVYNL